MERTLLGAFADRVRRDDKWPRGIEYVFQAVFTTAECISESDSSFDFFLVCVFLYPGAFFDASRLLDRNGPDTTKENENPQNNKPELKTGQLGDLVKVHQSIDNA